MGSNDSIDAPSNTFALIIGSGPIGLFTALSLAHYGHESLVIERHAERLGQPKAHVLNSRTLELFRQIGFDISELQTCGLRPEEAEFVRFASSLAGQEFGCLDRTQDPQHSLSPEDTFNVPQPVLEEQLLKSALKSGKVTFVRMIEWQSCVEDTSGMIVSQVLHRRTKAKMEIKSKYLFGCDGANARSRDGLGIDFQPPEGEAERVLHYASVHFKSDLSRFKPGLLWFILNNRRMGVFIAYNRKSSWVYFLGYDPSVTPPASLTSEFFKQLVIEGVGQPLPDYEELGITLWKTSPKIASSYRSPDINNAFLAGDAAHSFPPTGGLGLNTGIADVQNMIWKIEAVERGWAQSSLLDTISSERLPVARANALQSRLNEQKIFGLATQILTSERTASELMTDPETRRRIQAAIDDNRDHFHCSNLTLGYVYGQENERGPDDYRKELVKGCRLPHAWIEIAGKRASTLDLVDGREFVLIATAELISEPTLRVDGVNIQIKRQGKDFIDREGEWTALQGLYEDAAVLVRPDQHLVGLYWSIAAVKKGLHDYFSTD